LFARFSQRRSVIRQLIAFLALALAPWTAATPAQATLITYNMTGTITSASGGLANVGDHIAWTFQYNPNMAPSGSLTSSQGLYTPTNPVITNITDLTTGTQFFSPSSSSETPAAFLTLARGSSPTSSGWVSVQSIWGSSSQIATSSLWLINSVSNLPTTNLANLQMNNVPFNIRNFEYSYTSFSNPTAGVTNSSFTASVDPLSNPSSTPEPGSLTLFVVGALGLCLRRLHPRLARDS
jgi:hypothetical protein